MAAKYRGAIHKVCHRCNCDHPGDWVRFYNPGESRTALHAQLGTDADYEALCYTCVKPLYAAGLVKCIYWINKYGKDMYATGADRP